jgi:hypothetical protein
MTIPPDLEAQILRYYHVEKWRVGTIARQPQVHHGTVARVLGPGRPAQDRAAGTSLTAAVPITSATSSPVIDRARRRRPIRVCAACPASRGKSTGDILVIS